MSAGRPPPPNAGDAWLGYTDALAAWNAARTTANRTRTTDALRAFGRAFGLGEGEIQGAVDTLERALDRLGDERRAA